MPCAYNAYYAHHGYIVELSLGIHSDDELTICTQETRQYEGYFDPGLLVCGLSPRPASDFGLSAS